MFCFDVLYVSKQEWQDAQKCLWVGLQCLFGKKDRQMNTKRIAYLGKTKKIENRIGDVVETDGRGINLLLKKPPDAPFVEVFWVEELAYETETRWGVYAAPRLGWLNKNTGEVVGWYGTTKIPGGSL